MGILRFRAYRLKATLTRRLQRFRASIRQEELMVLRVHCNLLHLRLLLHRRSNLLQLLIPYLPPLPVGLVVELLLNLIIREDLRVLEVLREVLAAVLDERLELLAAVVAEVAVLVS